MAIQLGNFTPLEHKHYQLAETQTEKNANLEREMAKIAQQEKGANQRAAMQIKENARQADLRNDISQQGINAEIAQQGISNDQAQQRIDIDQQRLSASIAQQGIENAIKQRQENRYQSAADIAAAEESRKAEDYRQAQELKQIPVAMAKFGHYLTTAEPDKDGMVDVTDQKDNIKAMVGGFGDQDYKRITAQNVDGKTKLFGYTDDGKAAPLMRNGNPVAINNQVLQQQALFVSGGDAKSAKSQAELEQTQIENKIKRAELEYMKEHGVRMGSAGQDRQNVTISTNQLGGSNILNKDDGTLTVTDPKGKVISQAKIPGVGVAASSGVQQQDQQSQPTPPATPKAGDKMVFKQGPATFDGRRWVLDK